MDLTWAVKRLTKGFATSVLTTLDSGTVNNVGGGTGTTGWVQVSNGSFITAAATAADSYILEVVANGANLVLSAVNVRTSR